GGDVAPAPGGDDPVARTDAPSPATGPGGHADRDDGDGDDPDGLEVASTRGSIDPSIVDQRVGEHTAAIEACYASQVGRRRWLGGGLELSWDVRGDGTVAAVRIASSDLGAWPIEKCVLGVARAISFGRPHGDKPARVTAPISFSAGSGAVAWGPAQSDSAVRPRLARLSSCAPAPSNLTITLYLGTRGKVQSVGFASPAGFADTWADCAEKAIMGWSLTDPRGKVAKLSVTLNPSAGSDDDDETSSN
ncbi:MAG TPA: AgmX/PglI C-terminal domain-containing protein, partial [Kofleriaceae bacterium]|nr:AgmX/PglI C-terminal domain-containing protein [Kofleriaceae bacterium]